LYNYTFMIKIFTIYIICLINRLFKSFFCHRDTTKFRYIDLILYSLRDCYKWIQLYIRTSRIDAGYIIFTVDYYYYCYYNYYTLTSNVVLQFFFIIITGNIMWRICCTLCDCFFFCKYLGYETSELSRFVETIRVTSYSLI
jgi:hypothetical protein